jgi:hypothetical protein
MKKAFYILVFLFSFPLFSQTNYSDSWEDFYSYNNVKDFIKVDDVIYALADNSVFIYTISTKETTKLSSVQGLSGETTTTIFYSETYKRLIIGYETGLVEIVNEDGSIHISADIVNFDQSGEKSINHISAFGNQLFLSTPFAIVVYDIEKLEFGDTYFIGNASTAIRIYQTTVLNETIYAATEDGVFNAEISSPNLIDFNNWKQNFQGNSFNQITVFNDDLYATSTSNLFKINQTNLTLVRDFFEDIISLKASISNLSISLNTLTVILNNFLKEVFTTEANTTYNFTLNTSFVLDNILFLGTKEYGILISPISETLAYDEIHPEGPLTNSPFSITAKNNNLWVVYGGYDDTYAPIGRRQGYSYFNGENWNNIAFNSDFPVTDMVDVTIDPSNENKVFISSVGDTGSINSVSTGGLLVVEDGVATEFYNHLNSTLEDILPLISTRVTIRVSGSAFDRQGNLWVTNYEVDNKLHKLSPNGQWSSIDMSTVQTNSASGLNEIVVDGSNSIWIGTRRNGVYVYNENGARKRTLIENTNQGGLPSLNVRTVAIDKNNRVWLGTLSGLVVYSNASGVFDNTSIDAAPVIILDDGIPKKLLGDQTVNTIEVDGADNKWFGTDNGGVLQTNPNGEITLANFSKKNSPLPSNKILKIRVDESSGKVYFATDKGIVAYNSDVVPFGETLGEVYAYPNPALKNHQSITIDGRNGTHLPKGTNVKILDVAGNLVYETNVVEGQEVQGGKVIWDKTNLAGKKVASGVYIVLLIGDDPSETSVTKIAIIN